jgi:hypothetical protein
MNRIILVRSAQGERRYQPGDYPLAVGGERSAIPLQSAPGVVAYIGLEQGHPFVQPADSAPPLWHNHERLAGSTWLKSGDQLQLGDEVILWEVRGEQIIVSLGQAERLPLTPPVSPPPGKPPLDPVTPPVSGGWGGRRRGLRWALASLFALLLLAAAFILLAVPLTLQLEPEPASVSLRGFPPPIPFGERYLVLPGEYTLEAAAAGYRPLLEKITVTADGARRFRFSLAMLPGLVSIGSEPGGAVLQVDGEPKGNTPLAELELSPGRHRLRLELPRYRPLEQDLEVTGRGKRQQVTLKLAPDWGVIRITSKPAGAEIREQGKRLGQTPGELELSSGEHRLQLMLEGYKPHAFDLQVAAGEQRLLDPVRLEKLDGILTLSSRPAGGSVTLDGVYVGQTPLELRLEPELAHVLSVTRAGYRPARRTLELKSGEARRLEVPLQAEYGTLFITTTPADAELLVDGRPKGPATARLQLTARPHRIEIRKPGYLPYRREVTPIMGISRNLEVTLKREGSGSGGGKGGKGGSNGKGRQSKVAPVAVVKGMQRLAPVGSFTLGASRREPGRRANENLRQVSLSRPFRIAPREVTNGEFRRFRPGHSSGAAAGITLDGDDQPVVGVSWDDAARYANWLSAREGLPAAYRDVEGRVQLIRPVRLPSADRSGVGLGCPYRRTPETGPLSLGR